MKVLNPTYQHHGIAYQHVSHPKYAYKLTETYTMHAPLISMGGTVRIGSFVELQGMELTPPHYLTIGEGYAWDGPSGPAIHTLNFIRGSLIHDALYQLMRENLLDLKYRPIADSALYQACVEDGMNRWRAWYVRLSVQWFGGRHARPK